MEKILLLDNYDSFTYNLLHLLRAVTDKSIDVVRNDKISLPEINTYSKILISPGPGIPDEAGIIKKAIQHYAPTKSILGICLGHQAIGEVFGASLINMPEVCHGIATPIVVSEPDDRLFKNLSKSFLVGRYHSWLVDNKGLPDDLLVTASDEKGNIMALAHRHYDVKGVQFHPESILSEYGKELMKNWVNQK